MYYRVPLSAAAQPSCITELFVQPFYLQPLAMVSSLWNQTEANLSKRSVSLAFIYQEHFIIRITAYSSSPLSVFLALHIFLTLLHAPFLFSFLSSLPHAHTFSLSFSVAHAQSLNLLQKCSFDPTDRHTVFTVLLN